MDGAEGGEAGREDGRRRGRAGLGGLGQSATKDAIGAGDGARQRTRGQGVLRAVRSRSQGGHKVVVTVRTTFVSPSPPSIVRIGAAAGDSGAVVVVVLAARMRLGSAQMQCKKGQSQKREPRTLCVACDAGSSRAAPTHAPTAPTAPTAPRTGPHPISRQPYPAFSSSRVWSRWAEGAARRLRRCDCCCNVRLLDHPIQSIAG